MQANQSPWERLIWRKLPFSVAAVCAGGRGPATHPEPREPCEVLMRHSLPKLRSLWAGAAAGLESRISRKRPAPVTAVRVGPPGFETRQETRERWEGTAAP